MNHVSDDSDPALELRLQLARFEGEIKTLASQLAMLQAADEHHRAELEAARAEAADARAAEREWQGRLEECRRMIAELRDRVDAAEEARRHAEEDRGAVIAALGRKARRQLTSRGEPG